MKTCVVVLSCILLLAGQAGACTGVKARTGQGILVAANEDFDRTLRDVTTWVYPAAEDRYGYLGTGFRQHGYFMMGMNDQGLFLDMFTVPPRFTYERDPAKLDYNGFLEAKLLEDCATVDEAVGFLQSYNHPAMVDYSYQIFLVDRTGVSAVVNWSDEGYEVVRSEDDYQVVTNFYLLHPELGYHPCWRYDTASDMMADAEAGTYSFRLLRDILDSVHLNSNFSQICDLETGDVFVFDDHNFDEYVRINLSEALQSGYQEISMPEYFSRVDLVSPGHGETVSPGDVVVEWRGRAGSDYRLVYATNPDFAESRTIDVTEACEPGRGDGALLLAGLFVVLFPFRWVGRRIKGGMVLLLLLCALTSCDSPSGVDIPTGSQITTFRETIPSVGSGETVYWKIEASIEADSELTSESIVLSFTCGG